MSLSAVLFLLSTGLATPEIRRLGVDCVVQAGDIKRLEWRRNHGLWLWTTKGKVHVVCSWASTSPAETTICQPYLTFIQDAQIRGRKLTLSYPEHYDCRENFGGMDLVTPVVAIAIE